jgi:hypothetical protein
MVKALREALRSRSVSLRLKLEEVLTASRMIQITGRMSVSLRSRGDEEESRDEEKELNEEKEKAHGLPSLWDKVKSPTFGSHPRHRRMRR